ncbi:MAG: hypothetical protein IJF22_01300 [Clostridia bacterium]|nr:hypothetical protein [Clostridia bacterium]
MQNLDTIFKAISPNKFYNQTFQDLFFQEASSFLQTSFQCQVLLAYNISLGNTLKQISSHENSHFMLLGKVITLLGGKPELKNTKNQYFSGKNIAYATNAFDILLEDITLKENMIISYKTAIKKTGSLNLKKLLQQVLVQEEYHLEILKNVIKNFKTQSK